MVRIFLQRQFNGERVVFQQMMLKHHWPYEDKKMNVDLNFTPYQKILKLIVDQNAKHKIITF